MADEAQETRKNPEPPPDLGPWFNCWTGDPCCPCTLASPCGGRPAAVTPTAAPKPHGLRIVRRPNGSAW